MRIRRNAIAPCLSAEVVELGLGEAPLDEGARVDPRCRVPLHVDHVAVERFGAPPEEVIEADVVQHRRRLIGRDVPAHVRVLPRTQHHHHGVPTDECRYVAGDQ
ncbi:hypothetical protein SDC9_195137 [bioreactor metagenome]|uniref:Uncharacterized protein n=1 Tax=bioreactor metagenome TaxID=1076179 RepID=A0A645IGV0_9ZZZZ